MKQLVIFDLDGTLLNTIDDLGTACNHALRLAGYPTHDMSSYPGMVGNGVRRLVERALPEAARDTATVDSVLTGFREYYDKHNADLTRPYPGIHTMLRELSAAGIALAVASNKYADAVVKLVNHYFPDISWAAVEGQRDGVPVKPDPSVVFSILLQRPTPKTDVLYVGDSGVDMETASRACVDSAGVSWGFRPVSELTAANAGIIVDNPQQIVSIATRAN